MFNLNLLFLTQTCTNIAWRLICDTGVVSLARFPACGAIIVGIKEETEVTALDDLGFALVWWEDTFTAIKTIQVEMWKTHKTINIQRILILNFPKLSE